MNIKIIEAVQKFGFGEKEKLLCTYLVFVLI